MEETVDRIARRRATGDDLEVIVYTESPARRNPGGMPYQVEDLSEEMAHFTAPLAESRQGQSRGGRYSLPEDGQVRRLLLRNRIECAMALRTGARHVLVSFFLTKFGFVSQVIANELGLPHIACAAGTDLNRDLASSLRISAASYVVEHADWIVVRTREQAERLERLFNRTHGISVYNGGLPAARPRRQWRRNPTPHVSLVSDCGYSFKKSTHSLVEAFSRLLREGHAVTLTIAGKIEAEQHKYWTAAKQEWSDLFVGRACFRGPIGKDEVERMLLDGDVYCSASLGEGSPNGALFALSLGMPIVAPQTSSLADITDPAIDRVSLFRAGDRDDFYARLETMVAQVRDNSQPVDSERAESIRRRLLEEESRHWLGVIHKVATA
jgi:hypothetical protein